jgi:hypothetical protein
VTVQKTCRRARDEQEVREALDEFWKHPEKSEHTLTDLLGKNRDLYEFRKMLQESG